MGFILIGMTFRYQAVASQVRKGAKVLNYCVRKGNRWNHLAIHTELIAVSFQQLAVSFLLSAGCFLLSAKLIEKRNKTIY